MNLDGASNLQKRVGREHRRARILRATLVTLAGHSHEVIVRNLSDFGLGMTCRTIAPEKGESVTVRLPGDITVHGTVRWVTGQAFGVALDDKLEADAIEAALQRKSSEPTAAPGWQIEDRHRVYTPRVDPTKMRRV
ncbi:PilZ domain-containing protein [Novosphingobium huizhouense]|uniref:PilZ domain-containing protein n=1 Tax=Novosphingobium huizhouense TaxID=2866625 RepID=UPI001CD8D6A7|nr:PilZ domain-containing protein [Novosphingobium huizhouense]